jgi:hypothetical protein
MSDALHRLVVCVDIERSGSLRDGARPAVREKLHALFVSTLAEVGVGPDVYYKEDRGDGAVILVEPSVPKARLLGRWLLELNEQLREFNRERTRPIRLRVGLNCGEVRRDGEGFSGDAVDATFRLTNSDTARDTLAEATDATLAVIVSDRLFADVVAEGGQYIESANYQRVRATGHRVDTDAWVYVPRLGVPSVPAGGTGTGGAQGERTEVPAVPAAAQHDEPRERRSIQTEVYNEFGPVRMSTGIFGPVKNSKIGTAGDE